MVASRSTTSTISKPPTPFVPNGRRAASSLSSTNDRSIGLSRRAGAATAFFHGLTSARATRSPHRPMPSGRQRLRRDGEPTRKSGCPELPGRHPAQSTTPCDHENFEPTPSRKRTGPVSRRGRHPPRRGPRNWKGPCFRPTFFSPRTLSRRKTDQSPEGP
jgi:hypothetical protein